MTEPRDFDRLVAEGQVQVDLIVNKASDYGAYDARELGAELLKWQNNLICRLAFAEGTVWGLRAQNVTVPKEATWETARDAALKAGIPASTRDEIARLKRFVRLLAEPKP